MPTPYTLRWHRQPFDKLSPHLLYEIIRLRNEVFVVEQDCIYQDADGKDASALHLCGFDEQGKLKAYARILPKGVSYPDYPSVGRIAVALDARRKGLGEALVRRAIQECRNHYNADGIAISAQSHLEYFYSRLGFVAEGASYLEDGIPHRYMLLKFE